MPRRLSSQELSLIRSLATDIPSLWRAAETPAADRKEILRTLVERVTVTIRDATEHVQVRIHWVGGIVSEHPLCRPVGSYDRMADFVCLGERVRTWLTAGQTTAQIADGLNQEGFRSASGRLDRFTSRRVGELIYRLGLSKKRQPAETLAAGEWWVRDLAADLGMSVTRLRHWVKQGYVQVRKSKAWGQLVIWADAEELDRLRRLCDQPRQNRLTHYPTELTRPKERQKEVPKGKPEDTFECG